MKDANGHTLGPCFGHAQFDPDVCKHPGTAQFSSMWYEPKLMCGSKVAAPDHVPTAESPRAKPGKRGKAGEFWTTTCRMLQVRCWACGTVLSEGIHEYHIQEKSPEVLAALWRIPLEDARLISWHPSASQYVDRGAL